MQLNNSTIQPKKGHQKDKYQGQIHSVSKLRHGKGSYHFDNHFFTYEGAYINGKKNGQGVLQFKDGRVIKGTFVDNQLIGPAEIIYSDGSSFKGCLNFGQRSGAGTYTSPYEHYDGEWLNNQKHGHGSYKNVSTQQQYKGQYHRDKPHGKGQLQRWNYSYKGDFSQGLKEGSGTQINDWSREQGQKIGYSRYQFNGSFKADKFQGKGQYKSRQSAYVYNGEWQQGKPTIYPNEFRLYISANTKNGEQILQNQKVLLNLQPIQYQIQGESFNLYIESVYQGPEVLDENQPTPQQIDAMIKNWQNQNKKNKNPPPMPDFNQPKMKKPQIILVQQQTGRNVQLRLIKQVQGKDQYLKIDYRQDILIKRKQNQETKLQNAKKAEEEGNKKGGKKDTKGEVQLKVNIFKDKPALRETVLKTETADGRAVVARLQFPDDIPQGNYFLQIKSVFADFGQVKPIRKEINMKGKQAIKKK